MSKLTDTMRYRNESNNGNRRYTLRDMAIIKHDDAVRNAQVKRGVEMPKGQNQIHIVCGCGMEGCFMHRSYENVIHDFQKPLFNQKRN